MTDLSKLSDAELIALHRQSQSPDVRAMVTAAAQRHGVDPALAMSVARQESGLRTNAVSPKGAIGPMQLMPGTARELGVDPHDVAQNIDGGVRYLKQQVDRFGDPELAAAAYNAGPGAVQRYGGVPPYAETQNYVKAVTGGAGGEDLSSLSDAELQALYHGGGQAADNAPAQQVGAEQAADYAPAPVVVTNAETGKPYNDAQQRTYAQLIQSGQIDPNARPGSKAFPRGLASSNDRPVPGEWYVDTQGQLLQAPGLAEDVGAGVARGAGNAAAGFADMVGQASPLGSVLQMLGTATSLADLKLPSSAPFSGFSSAISDALPTPETREGRWAQTATEMLPNAAFGAGGLVQRAANVVLPTIGAEGAAEAVRVLGGGETAQDVARAVGGVVGGLGTGVRLNERPARTPAPQPKTLEQLAAEKKALYDQVDASGFRFTRQQVRNLANELDAAVRQKGGPRAAKASPQADSIIARVRALSAQKGGVSLSQMDEVRRDIYPLLMEAGGSDSVYGAIIRNGIDKLASDTKAPLLKEARAANTRWAKADEVTRRVKSAELAAGRAHSGENRANAVSQKLSPMIDPMHSQQVQNLTPDEAASIERIVIGDDAQNGLRRWEKRLRNPLFIGPAASTGAMVGTAAGGPVGGVVGAGLATAGMQTVGQMLRSAAEKRQAANLQELIDLISIGGEKAPKRPGMVGHQANFPALVAANPSLAELVSQLPQAGSGTRVGLGLAQALLPAPALATSEPLPEERKPSGRRRQTRQ